MKYLLILVVIAIVGWFLLRARTRAGADVRKHAAETTSQQVVACRHCGVHLPRAEAVADLSGVFCSEAHRLAGPRPP